MYCTRCFLILNDDILFNKNLLHILMSCWDSTEKVYVVMKRCHEQGIFEFALHSTCLCDLPLLPTHPIPTPYPPTPGLSYLALALPALARVSSVSYYFIRLARAQGEHAAHVPAVLSARAPVWRIVVVAVYLQACTRLSLHCAHRHTR